MNFYRKILVASVKTKKYRRLVYLHHASLRTRFNVYVIMQDIVDELIKAHFTPLTLEGLQLGGKKPESSPTVLTESQLRLAKSNHLYS